MKFHTDHHFIIGHNHFSDGKPCQDYALSGVIGNTVYAVVSDGCSGAGKTDIGSRIITMTTVKVIQRALKYSDIDGGFPAHIYEYSMASANSAKEILGLSERDMLATHLFVVVNEENRAAFSVYGDGAVVVVSKTGIINAYLYEWAQNMPFYSHQDRARFIDAHGGPKTKALLETYHQIAPDGEIKVTVEHPFSTEQGCNGVCFDIDIKATDTALICLFTDGIKQVDNMDLFDALRSLVGFKTFDGSFVKRRLIRFLADSKKIGCGPLDDLGVAVIAIENEEHIIQQKQAA